MAKAVTLTNNMPEATQDVRYRVLVLLQRSDRPDYFTFFCPRCQMPIAELSNGTIEGMSDIVDFDSRSNIGIGVPHKGRLHTGGYCRIRYYFTLGETK